MRNPVLLSGHTLTEKERLHPDTMQIIVNLENVSTATITMAAGTSVKPGDWVRVYTPQDRSVVMRVKTTELDIVTNVITLTLEDLTSCLRDDVWFGEITTAMLAGTTGTVQTVRADTAIRNILRQQSESVWTLGTVEYTDAYPYDFTSPSLYDAIQTICSALEDWYWDVNMDALPFVLNIRKRSTTAACEMRMNRNMISVKQTVDMSQMYTRLYPVGNKNVKITSINNNKPYVEKNTNIYGVVSKTETDSTITKAELLKAWAQRRLDRHCEPLVTVTINGLELSAATGESIDRLTVGTLCRLPLMDYVGAVVLERINTLSWQNAIGAPEMVTVTLANNLQDVASIVSQLKKSGGGGAAKAAQDAEEDHAWIVDDNEKIMLVAEAVAGKDADGNPNWSRVSTLTVDGNGIDARVTKAEGDQVKIDTRLTVAEGAITSKVDSSTYSTKMAVLDGQISSIVSDVNGNSSSITQLNNSITAKVDSSTYNTKMELLDGQISSLVTDVCGNSSSITQLSNSISSKVSKGDIISEINQTAGEVKISADKISLDGKTIAGSMVGEKISCESLYAEDISVVSGNLFLIDGTTLDDYIDESCERIVNASVSTDGKTLTLTKEDGTTVNFNKATLNNGSWDSGTWKVTASDGQSKQTTLTAVSLNTPSQYIAWDKTNKLLKVQIDVTASDGNTGYTSDFLEIPANKAYDSGYSDGQSAGSTTSYNNGWNDCVDEVASHKVTGAIGGMTRYNGGAKIKLYYYNSSGSLALAGEKNWYYRSTVTATGPATTTMYSSLPAKK